MLDIVACYWRLLDVWRFLDVGVLLGLLVDGGYWGMLKIVGGC